MLKNYLITAIRNLARRKVYTLINISGLSIGLTVCMLIFLIVRFDSGFDQFHAKKDRIYRVLTEYHHADAPEIFYGPGVPHPMPAALRSQFPQIQKVATIYTEGNDQILVLNENGQVSQKFKESKGVFFTEPSFFEIFDFPFLAGDPVTALKDPNCVVLTKDIAEKYFGEWTSAMGKLIRWNNRENLKVTGILKPVPPNTDFQLKMAISFGTGYTKRFLKSTDWDGTGSAYGCYVLANRNFSLEGFNRELREFSRKMKSPENKDSHILQPLSLVHFDTHSSNYSGKSVSPQLITVLWMIATFILLIACVNFINLSTAQAVNRAREVGVRKVLGGRNPQLRLQFLTEAFLIVTISVFIATQLSLFSLPVLNRLLDKNIQAGLVNKSEWVLFISLITVLVTLLSGFYPSVVLSRFNPINALKTKMSSPGHGGISLRRGLVVFQFVIAQVLIIGTLVTLWQMKYFTSQSLGFDKDAVLNIPFAGDSTSLSKLGFLRKKLEENKGIRAVSFSSNTPVENDNDDWSTFRFDHANKETDFYAITKWTDDQYLPLYKLTLLAGRNLQPSDTVREFVVNELLVKNLGLRSPEEALGKEIDLGNGWIKGTIVGVVKEFRSRSFRRDLAPVLMTTMKRGYNMASIKLNTAEIPATLQAIEKIWNELFPNFVYEYQFLDSKIESFYQQENQLAGLYRWFAIIAILLSCLGLYGLASYMAAQRLKEVGIRKTLGATVEHIVYLFSREFILLILLAFLIATPISWYFMQRWLEDYPYHIRLSWWIFLTGGVLSVLVALCTVSYHAIRAALSNPVKSLRME